MTRDTNNNNRTNLVSRKRVAELWEPLPGEQRHQELPQEDFVVHVQRLRECTKWHHVRLFE